MGQYINKEGFADILSTKSGIPKKQAEELIDILLDEFIMTLKDGRDVRLTGFGTFTTRIREARMGVNPRNPTERIEVPTVRVVKFKPGQVLKKSLKS